LSLLLPLGAFAAILAAITFGGTLVAAALFPPGSTSKPSMVEYQLVPLLSERQTPPSAVAT